MINDFFLPFTTFSRDSNKKGYYIKENLIIQFLFKNYLTEKKEKFYV